jgi:histone deacetylase 4/5
VYTSFKTLKHLEMAASGVGLVYDSRMCAHENESDRKHPEQPARITSIYQRLTSAGVVARCVKVEAREATNEELSSVHTQNHVELMKAVSSKNYGKHRRKALASRYDSIFFNNGSSKSALLAAGSVIEVADQVAQGKLKAGAAIVRPPGHHAEADAAMGFCLFNNVAVAAHLLVHKKVLLSSQED